MGAVSVSNSISQCSSTVSGVDCPNAVDSGVDLMMASSLGKDVALGSRMDAVAGSVAGGGSSLWFMAGTGSVSGSVAGSGVSTESLAEDIPFEASGLDQAGRWLLAMVQALRGWS